MSTRSSTASLAGTTERGSAHQHLRAATAEDHARLDGRFACFDLGEADQYRSFLTAHARALPAVERALDAAGFAERLADWPERRRGDALAADLTALAAPLPEAFPAPSMVTPAAQWGAAYVVEGSRLGGAVLARQVGEGLPKAYLGTPPAPGVWRRFLAAMDAALTTDSDRAEAAAAARATFRLFEAAVE